MSDLVFLNAATPTQISQLIGLYRHEGWWYTDTDAPEVVAGIIAGSHCFVVAIEDGVIIGMGRAISDRISDAYIQDVTVRHDRRDRGIGSRIINTIKTRLQQDGIGWIALIAERDSAPFYETMGFVPMRNAQPLILAEK